MWIAFCYFMIGLGVSLKLTSDLEKSVTYHHPTLYIVVLFIALLVIWPAILIVILLNSIIK